MQNKNLLTNQEYTQLRGELLQSALAFAQRGFRVGPVYSTVLRDCACKRGKQCDKPGKHPVTPEGIKAFSADQAEIESRWRHNTDNLGVAVGDTVCVLDIDPRNGGDEGLRHLIEVHGELPATWEVLTGGGGQHLYFRLSGKVGRLPNRLAVGVELKTGDNYVIAPPSIHASGNRYKWKAGHSPNDIEMAEAPAWLLSRAEVTVPANDNYSVSSDNPAYAEAARRNELRAVSTAPEGKRNDTLYYAGLRLGRFVVSGDLDEGSIIRELVEAAVCAGLSEPEAKDAAQRGVRDGKKNNVQFTEIGRAEHPEGNEADARIRLWSLGELRNRPKPEWLVEGMIRKGGLISLYGDAGSGKTFLALDWALCATTGREWHGRSVVAGEVVYLLAEDSGDLPNRIDAWTQEFGAINEDRFHVIPDAVDLHDPDSADRLIDAIRTQLGSFPELIVIDTLARCFGDGDENYQKDMNLFVRNCDRLRSEFPHATVLLVHHTGKDSTRGARGSSVLRAALHTEMEVQKTGSGIILKCKKQKSSREFEPINLTVQEVQLDDVNASCVLTLASNREGFESLSGRGRNPNDQKCLEALKANGENGLPRGEWEGASVAAGVRRGTFKNCVLRLTYSGEVRQGQDRRYRVVGESGSPETGSASCPT